MMVESEAYLRADAAGDEAGKARAIELASLWFLENRVPKRYRAALRRDWGIAVRDAARWQAFKGVVDAQCAVFDRLAKGLSGSSL